MADKQELQTYVKLGRRGLIARTPTTAREEVQMRFGGGWIRKDSPAAPSAEAVQRVEQAAEAQADKVAERRAEVQEQAADAAANAVPADDVAEPAPNTGTRTKTATKAQS